MTHLERLMPAKTTQEKAFVADVLPHLNAIIAAAKTQGMVFVGVVAWSDGESERATLCPYVQGTATIEQAFEIVRHALSGAAAVMADGADGAATSPKH